MRINMLDGEFWYGGYVRDGLLMPIGKKENRIIDLSMNLSANQVMPLFLSSKGRYLWSDIGYSISFQDGVIEVNDEVEFREGFQDLRGAYLESMKKHFPFSGKEIDLELFKNPIYNSWIELTFFQNEADILTYAEQIKSHGMPAGVLMIDDGWSESYGDWRFHKGKFPHAKDLINQLHTEGFKVMLWVCPYVTPDTVAYREARDKGLLILNSDRKPFITEWWNGYSAVLDFSNPETVKWMKNQLNSLCELGVDGFKFDAGDSIYYRDDNVTYGNTTPDEQSLLWAKFGEDYPLNEYRVTYKAGGMSLLQRLCDKEHSWGENGLKALIPHSLLQGITGHPFSCPDMIGGGEYLNFQSNNEGGLDQELFVRHCEIACLMPAMQFSAAPFRVLNEENFTKILTGIKIREQYKDIIIELVQQAKNIGEPIIRYMTYEFPEESVEEIIDQFMLGDRILVAPIVVKGAKDRNVYIPKGDWDYNGERISSKGDYYKLSAEEGTPIILSKI